MNREFYEKVGIEVADAAETQVHESVRPFCGSVEYQRECEYLSV